MTATNDSASTAMPTRAQKMLAKARRLVAEGAVDPLPHGIFYVEGDSARHKLAFSKNSEEPDLHCSCKAGSFAQGCSHRMAVELHLSQKRRVA